MGEDLVGIASYNVLAPCYVRPVDKRTGSVQAFAAFEWCSDEALDWSRRRPLLMGRLRDLCETCCVVCLQEVEFVESKTNIFSAPSWVLESLQADWRVVIPKQRDLARNADRNERVLGKRLAVGNAIVAKTVDWSLALSSTSVIIAFSDWVVANVHLDATSEQKRIDSLLSIVGAIRQARGPNATILLCGDFNAEFTPGSPLGNFLSSDNTGRQREDDDDLRRMDFENAYGFEKDFDAWVALCVAAKAAASLSPTRFRRVDTGQTRAAYDHRSDHQRDIATWRLDHILFDDTKATFVRKGPSLEDINPGDALKVGLPNDTEPSDHYPVVAYFSAHKKRDPLPDEDDLLNLLEALKAAETADALEHSKKDAPVKKKAPPTPEERAAIQRYRQTLKDARTKAVQRRRAFVQQHLQTDRRKLDWFELRLFNDEKGKNKDASSSRASPSDSFLFSRIDDWVLAAEQTVSRTA